MKKNITINLWGRLYQIDEDAYDMLQNYIESLRSSFGKQEGGYEIIDDIEARIAELFDELRQNGAVAITIDNVKDIITRIGKPEQLTDEEDSQTNKGKDGQRYDSFQEAFKNIKDNVRSRTANKKLFRNPKDKMVAGVASGLATYTGTDAIIWRLLTALLIAFYGTGLIAYFVLAIIIPEAKTPEQIQQMEGKNDTSTNTATKKLFRNPKDKMITGLLSGLAAYTNSDTIIWRLLAVFLTAFYGVGLIAYIILAIVVPEANTPEQLLQMEGKEVTPQNIADVVVEMEGQTKQHRSPLYVFFKILFFFLIGIATLVSIKLSGQLLFSLIALTYNIIDPSSNSISLGLDSLGMISLYHTAHHWFFLYIIALLAMILIPVYATLHMLLSLTKKIRQMGTLQCIMWTVIWIASICVIVLCAIKMGNRNYDITVKSHKRTTMTHDGVEMSKDDAIFLIRGKWDLLKAENCSHFTYSGRYPNGNKGVRYLDTYNEYCDAILHVEHKQNVTPGVYRMDCLVRAQGPGTYIYVKADTTHMAEIPAFDNKPAGLYKMLLQELDDSIKKDVSLQNLHLNIDSTDVRTHKYYLDGWSVLSFDNIIVNDSTIAYGMSSDPEFTGHPCRSKWFSATDFTITRIDDLPKKE